MFVILGVILAAGALFWFGRSMYERGRDAERIAQDEARVDTAKVARAAAARAVDSVKKALAPIIAAATALHDSVKVVDVETVEIPALGQIGNSRVRVEIPPIVVRRLVADSLSLLAKDEIIMKQTAQLVADSLLIGAQATEITHLKETKTPICGGRCKGAVAVAEVGLVSWATVQVVRLLRQ